VDQQKATDMQNEELAAAIGYMPHGGIQHAMAAEST
jgi:hypothetical protein